MIRNHITKRRMVDNQVYTRRFDPALILVACSVLSVGIAVAAFIWAHPVG